MEPMASEPSVPIGTAFADLLLQGPEHPSLWNDLTGMFRKAFRWRGADKRFTLSVYVMSVLQGLIPILDWWKTSNLKFFRSDLMAGLTLASLSIPQVIVCFWDDWNYCYHICTNCVWILSESSKLLGFLYQFLDAFPQVVSSDWLLYLEGWNSPRLFRYFWLVLLSCYYRALDMQLWQNWILSMVFVSHCRFNLVLCVLNVLLTYGFILW